MNAIARQLLVAATSVVMVVVVGCSSDERTPADQSLTPGNAADGYPLERALVACIQDNGIDSELRPDGSVSSDKNGTLSRDQWRALRELCFQRLEDEGFVLHEEPSDGSTESTYNAWVTFRECMIDQGIALGEFGSLESYAANPEAVDEIISAAVRENFTAFEEAHLNCPSRHGLIGVSVIGE